MPAAESGSTTPGTERYVVMYGDWGGTFNLVAPMSLVSCGRTTQEELCQELARLADGTKSAGELKFVDARPGDWISILDNKEPVPDDVDYVYNRVRATRSVYLSDQLVDLGIRDKVNDVLAKRRGDVAGIFSPDIDALASAIGKEGVSREEFEVAMVRILHSMIGKELVAERLNSRLARGHSREQPDIKVIFDYEGLSTRTDWTELVFDCALKSSEINLHLDFLAKYKMKTTSEEEAARTKRERRDVVRYALITNAPQSEIPKLIVEKAQAIGVSILPMEQLTELIASIKDKVPAKKLAGKLHPGISRF